MLAVYLEMIVTRAYIALHLTTKIVSSFLEPKGNEERTDKTASFLLRLE